MKDRIKQYMDYKSISAGELSSLLEVQRSNISHILNGRNKPGASFIEKLLINFPDLNARWLFTGEGEMAENIVVPVKNPTVSHPEKSVEQKELKFGEAQALSDAVVRNSEKPIDKVVLLFSDGTFADFNRK